MTRLLNLKLSTSRPPISLFLTLIGLLSSYIYRSSPLLQSYRPSSSLVILAERSWNALGLGEIEGGSGDGRRGRGRETSLSLGEGGAGSGGREGELAMGFGSAFADSALRSRIPSSTPVAPNINPRPSGGGSTPVATTTTNNTGVEDQPGFVRQWTEGLTGTGASRTSRSGLGGAGVGRSATDL